MTPTSRALALIATLFLALGGCGGTDSAGPPTVGFVDAFQDSTIARARDGFLQALADKGYSEADGTLRVIYRNAQGDIPTLTQIVKYLVAEGVTLMATSPSLSTITAIQNTREIPIFMMVAPTPELMQVRDSGGRDPPNLFGVAENLDYIDTSFSLIPHLLTPRGERLRVGLLYNQSEPQSVAAHRRLSQLATELGVELVARPVNTTADVHLVTGALLNANLDGFFANPDNTVFGAFETILKSCDQAGVPIFTSEAGLVARGAVAAYGADIYTWGYQAGEQAATFLSTGSTAGMTWEMVQLRHKVYNPEAAERFGIGVPPDFVPAR